MSIQREGSRGALPAGRGSGGFLSILAVFLLTAAPPLLAQTDTGATSDAPDSYQPRAVVLGGAHGLGGDELHPFGGVEAGLFRGRYGGMVLGQFGRGNEFESLFLAGGPAVELGVLGPVVFTVYGGLAWYQEEIDAGFSRDLTGPFAALSLRYPLPLGVAGFTVSAWGGSLDDEGFERSVGVTPVRFSLGLGL